MVRLLIAEDEEFLRKNLQNKLLKYWPEAKIVSCVENGEDALKSLNKDKPDIAFLDIQMGDLTGIEVAQLTKHKCHIVFITAYDQYAIAAFETGAIDYLLKPYSDKRLQECIERLNIRLSASPIDIKHALSDVDRSQKTYLKRLKIQIGNKFWLIPVEDVICFKASGRYVKVLTKEREALVRVPLKSLCEQLDSDIFWQIHRSTVLNIKQLDYVQTTDCDQMNAFMKGLKEPLSISRSYGHLFRNLSAEV